MRFGKLLMLTANTAIASWESSPAGSCLKNTVAPLRGVRGGDASGGGSSGGGWLIGGAYGGVCRSGGSSVGGSGGGCLVNMVTTSVKKCQEVSSSVNQWCTLPR